MKFFLACATACAVAVGTSLPGGAQGRGPRPNDLPDRARAAERVVVATITEVQSAFEPNRFGDVLIVSTASVRVTDVLKGPREDALSVAFEGGTVGDVTLSVSDMPSLSPSARVVMFLEREPSGRFRPSQRGRGVLQLDASGQVRGTDMTLDEVKAAVAAALR
jgi:hypothetical protein